LRWRDARRRKRLNGWTRIIPGLAALLGPALFQLLTFGDGFRSQPRSLCISARPSSLGRIRGFNRRKPAPPLVPRSIFFSLRRCWPTALRRLRDRAPAHQHKGEQDRREWKPGNGFSQGADVPTDQQMNKE